MTSERAQFDAFVSIQLTKGKTPLYAQLADAIWEKIDTGVLAPGYPLPPVRQLAKVLGVNPGTVVRAYKELEQGGRVISRQGSGSVVAERQIAVDSEPRDLSSLEEITNPEYEAEAESGAVNMRSISLNPDVVSIRQFRGILSDVLDRDGARAFSYTTSQGFLPLRESIAAYLENYGVKADPAQIQIISGAQQGIDIAARALLNRGDTVMTESPTYPGAIAAFRARGAQMIGIPMTPDGIDLTSFEAHLRRFRPRLVYLMPNIQNPTGYSYSLAARQRIMGLLRFYDAWLLEDDYMRELTYDKDALAPLKALDRDDRVIYLKSFSKIFMPGLRLAFLCLPQALLARFRSVKRLTDIATSGLTQRVFDLYLRRNLWPAHVANLRRVYGTQFRYTERRLEEILPSDATMTHPDGGLSFWITLPRRVDGAVFCAEAAKRGLLLADGSPFYPHGTDRGHIRLSHSTLTLQQVESGLSILQQTLSRFS